MGYADEYVHSIKSKNVQQENRDQQQQEIEKENRDQQQEIEKENRDQQQEKDKQQQHHVIDRQEEDEGDSFLGERNVICDGSVKCDSHHKDEDDKEEELQDDSLIVESAENIASNICREMTKLTSLIHKVGNLLSLSIYLSVCLSIYLSIYLSICLLISVIAA